MPFQLIEIHFVIASLLSIPVSLFNAKRGNRKQVLYESHKDIGQLLITAYVARDFFARAVSLRYFSTKRLGVINTAHSVVWRPRLQTRRSRPANGTLSV